MSGVRPAGGADASIDDAALARRVAGGDHAAFEMLMRRYNRRLYRTARGILRDDAEAEDALQEGYLHAYAAIGNFRGEAQLATWLTRIVANEALMRLRKRTRRAEVVPLDTVAGDDFGAFDDEAAGGLPGLATAAAAAASAPEVVTLRHEVRRIVEARIDALPEVFRVVFALRAVEELSVEEVAEVLSIPAATVRTRYFRARGLLREALARDLDLAIEDAFSFAGARCDRIVAAVLARLAADPQR